jgi:hypothetical protein
MPATKAVVSHDTSTLGAIATKGFKVAKTVKTKKAVKVSAVVKAVKATKSTYAFLEQLVVERTLWEQNAYRTSNEQLYELLGKCYAHYKAMCVDTDAAAAMRESADIASINLYSRTLAPLLLANAADAANVQIEALDQAVRELSKKLKPGEFEKAMAVITGPKTPREGNLQFQYFVFAFGAGSAGTRVLYIESIFDREAALGVLRTVLNDRVASQAFFGETYRLERDLMADGATVELMRRFGHLGNQPRSLVK